MNRATRLGPLIFALAGAGLGICVEMLLHNKYPYQIHFEDSLPSAILGAFVGAMVGCSVSSACIAQSKLIGPAGLVSAALLGATILGPLGWFAGCDAACNRRLHDVDFEVEEQVQHLPPVGMAVGAGLGCLLGLVLGCVQMHREGRKPIAANIPPRPPETLRPGLTE